MGLVALVLGSLIYVLVRPEGSSYLSCVFHYPLALSLEHFPFINNLPSLFHVLGFSLLTLAVLNNHKYALASCLFWFAINVLFEVGQHSFVVQWLDMNKIEWPRVNFRSQQRRAHRCL